jgi:hypothetical protein
MVSCDTLDTAGPPNIHRLFYGILLTDFRTALTSHNQEYIMVTLNVFDPSGATEITRLHASRLDALANKNIALLSDDMWQAHRMLPVIREYLQATFPDIEVIPETAFPMGSIAMDRDETAEWKRLSIRAWNTTNGRPPQAAPSRW